jgi:CHAD domain-containing protein
VRAHATTRAAAALARAIADQGARLLDAWPSAVDGDAEALRRVRIATRRLRAMLPLVDAAGVGAATRRVARDLKRVGRAHGPSRERLVAREDLQRAAREHPWPAHDVARVERWLDRRIARADRARRRTLRGIDVRGLSERLGALTLALPDTEPSLDWARLVGDLLVRRATRAARARDACGTLYEPEQLHTLRIALKKLRYTTELVDIVTHRRGAALLAALKQAQQRYGRLHDRQVLLAEARACAAAFARSRTASTGKAILDDLEADCRRWHGDAMTAMAEVDDCVAGALWLARALVAPRRAPARAPLPAIASRRRAG